jgi:hypothetical protein
LDNTFLEGTAPSIKEQYISSVVGNNYDFSLFYPLLKPHIKMSEIEKPDPEHRLGGGLPFAATHQRAEVAADQAVLRGPGTRLRVRAAEVGVTKDDENNSKQNKNCFFCEEKSHTLDLCPRLRPKIEVTELLLRQTKRGLEFKRKNGKK